MKKRTLLVTSALPYANGHLHLGHLVEHIQTDIWVRTHQLLGHTCISVCGDDAHGTPIMLKAEQLNLSPEELTDTYKRSHEADFNGFAIHYDVYHTTHSPENQALTETIFNRLVEKGDILKKEISQAFDLTKNMFLPDRYVKGTCPKCHVPDQYGDNCEACGATYLPTELIHPVSALSGSTPVEKKSEHYFFNLPNYEAFLKTWTQAGHIQTEMANKLSEWFDAGLKTWDISRDAPYFGFLIPGTTDKYFYVWLDAPIGYMASFQKYCERTNTDFNAFWGVESQTELYHFVGKDILYFHALFWPAVLHAANFRLPTAIYTHGFLTVNGQKMSKSRGTFIEARTYLNHLDPQYLRYYFAAKLNGRTEDLDLNFEDFTNRINADLVGKVVNIASRSCGFIHKYFDGHLATSLHNEPLFHTLLEAKASIIEAYVSRDYASAMRLIMDCAAMVNQYIDLHKPWSMVKDPAQRPEVHQICTTSLNLFKVLITYLKPVLPMMAEASETLFLCAPFDFQNCETPLLNQRINAFVPMIQRVDPVKIQALLNEPHS
jgi:methionyl-tRNA synthetase